MCGFLVEYSPQNLLSKEHFQELLDLSKKRGPNSQGYEKYKNIVQMGFNRLAILDLSENGNQPFTSHQNNFLVVFNGEIYNHQELRRQLQFNSFKGNSDTETITACLEEWGIKKTVSKLDGMFAISIFDKLTNEITLIRDFAGIKPLFYGYSDSKLVASSQYDQIISHQNFKHKSIDPAVLKLYLQQHFLPLMLNLPMEQ